jgi:hypothetical protein
MSFGITINGHTGADSAEVKAIAEDAWRKLKALPGATNVHLTGWANEATGGSVTLADPVEESADASAPT